MDGGPQTSKWIDLREVEHFEKADDKFWWEDLPNKQAWQESYLQVKTSNWFLEISWLIVDSWEWPRCWCQRFTNTQVAWMEADVDEIL